MLQTAADNRVIGAGLATYGKLETLAHMRAASPNLVPGEGPVPAPLMLVGEAPGEDEVSTLRPFTGRSGKLLDDHLAEAGIFRRMCYVTNAVKYRPLDSDGNNRAPFFNEISASLPLLLTEVAVINPVILITLGATPLKALAPRLKLSQAHGELRPHTIGIRNVRLLPLFHPSYCLRDPKADKANRVVLCRLMRGKLGA